MTPPRVASLVLTLALVACASRPAPIPTQSPPAPVLPTRDFPISTPEIRGIACLPLERNTETPARYGLYSAFLTLSANRNAAKVLSTLFKTTGSADDAVLARENLNLIVIPVKDASAATRALASARNEPDHAAAEVLKLYDFSQAALLMAGVCHRDRGAEVKKICDSATLDGPLLVTSQRPLDGTALPGDRLLIVNLSQTPVEAIPEVVATYRRRVMDKVFDKRDTLDGWRLQALNHLLAAANVLPGITKAYAIVK